MHRRWYAVALALLAAGLYGLQFLAPIRPDVDPEALTLRFPGSNAVPGTIEVPRSGDYAIWASGDPERDANRCRITTPAGTAVPVTAPARRVLWEVASEDDAVYTWIAGFRAAEPGSYGIRCSPDPAAPGAAYTITGPPGTGPAMRRGVAGAAGVLAALVLATVTFARRRRAAVT